MTIGIIYNLRSRNMTRTHLIKRTVATLISTIKNVTLANCNARPIPHPDGKRAFLRDGVVEYEFFIVNLTPEIADTIMPQITKALNEVGIVEDLLVVYYNTSGQLNSICVNTLRLVE